MLNRIRRLLGQWRSNVLKVLPSGSAKRPVVGASHGEAQIAIWPTEYFISVMVVLPIVFPEADSADFIAATFSERFVATARASKRKIAERRHAV